MNPTDWAVIEDGLAEYMADLPRKRRPVPPANANDFLMGEPAPEPEETDDPPFITAKYDGRCSACEEFHILAGETRIRADGANGWEAEECAW